MKRRVGVELIGGGRDDRFSSRRRTFCCPPARAAPRSAAARRDRGDRHGLARAVGDPAAMAVRRARRHCAASCVAARDAPLVRDVRGIFGGYDRWRALHRTTGLFVAAGFVHGVLDGTPFDDAPVLRWSYVAVGGDRAGVLRLPRAARALLPVAPRLRGRRRSRDRRGSRRGRDAADRPPRRLRARPVRDGLPRSQGRLAPASVHDLQRSARRRRPRHRQGARRLHVAPARAHRAGHAGGHRRPARALQPLAGTDRQVWIAGGVGVAPFLSWLRALDGHLPHRVDFFYTADGEAPFAEEIRAIASAPRVAARASDRHERRGPPHPRARPRRRRRRPPRAVGLHVRPAGDAAHLPDRSCGSAGVPARRIHREYFDWRCVRRCHERPRADDPARLDGGDPRVRRPAGLGRRSRRLRGLRQPGRPRGARLRRSVRAARPLRSRRHPLQAPRRVAVPGRGLPDDEGPRDGRVGPDGRGLVRPPRRLDVPGVLHLDADRHARRPGCGRRLQGHRGAARGRAGAARARGDPRDGRPAGVGHRLPRPLPLRQSGRARRARVLRALGAGGQARARHRPLQVPRRVAVPRGGLPARPGPQGGGDAAGHRGLARAQGRLDRARHLLVGAVRAARRSRVGDRVQRRRGAAPRRGGGARARRRAGAGGGAAGRAAAHHRGRRRGARPARARPARRRPAAVRQRDAPAAAGRAPGGRRIQKGRGSCARRRSSWRAPASTSCAGWPPASTRRSSPTAASARRWSPSPRGCRFP